MEFRPTGIEEVETEFMRERKARRAEHYFRGPMRIADIHVAAKLGGSCLALLLAIHHRATVTGHDVVTLPSNFLVDFGIGPAVKSRNLKMLEKAKFITVERKRGNSVRVKLIAQKRQQKIGCKDEP
jgi:hypothetical protein